jgi:uncharacterized protein (TIGR02145 family)
MAENLAYLPSVNYVTSSSSTEKRYYVYGYNGIDVDAAKATNNYKTFGVHYNWLAAMDGAASSSVNPSGVRGACPAGWHLPGDAEWKQLEKNAGMSVAESDAVGERGTDQGKKLKTTSGWNNNGNGTNAYGFSALPSGYCWVGNGFYHVGNNSYWWSATEYDETESWARIIYYSIDIINRTHLQKKQGYSIRCVKD